MSCLQQAGAHDVRIAERSVTATTKGRTADIVPGDLDQGDYTVPIRIIVNEDDYLPSGDLSTAGFATEAITNSLTSWDGDASRPSALLSCLQTERLDA